MKKIIANITLVLTVSSPVYVFAHEGHDHDKPAGIEARKGGEIKALENINVEVLAKGKDLKVYFFEKDNKVSELVGFKIAAFAELPRGKQKRESLSLKKNGDHYTASFDAKGAHRYTLILSVTDPAEGHADELKYTIEPKK